MQYPAEAWDIVRQADERYKTYQDTCRHAEKNLRAHPAFETFIDAMIRGAVEEMVQFVRRNENKKLRRGGAPDNPNRVSVGASRSIQEYANRFAYRIGGTHLGLMTIDDIKTALAMRESQIETAVFEKHLLAALKPLVPEGKRVQDTVSQKKLDAIWTAAERARDKAKKAV